MTTRLAKRQGVKLNARERKVKQVEFLRVFSQTGNVSLACKAAGVSRNTFYHWKEMENTHFLEDLAVAEVEACEALEAEAYRRAVQGVKREKPYYWQGELVGKEIIVEYSDSLLKTLLAARMPEKYRDSPQAVAQQQIILYPFKGREPRPLEELDDGELAVIMADLEARA